MTQSAKVSNERQVFDAVFPRLAQDILRELPTYDNMPEDGIEWLKKNLEYNVPGGKMNRGLSVPATFEAIKGRPATEDESFKANLLGWLVEILQAFFLVADDIMDGSKTRRGQPCWYKVDGVGMIAINDGFILESIIYKLLKQHFRNEPYYLDVVELFHEVTYQTELGQMMDLITAPEDKVDLDRFSMHKYKWIVKYKTAFYSFYLPVALGMYMAGIANETSLKSANDILLPLGEYFQVQDDYLDCFGDPKVIGKIGTDIEDNKCGWLINQALLICSPEQRKTLTENYGKKDATSVEKVKQIYRDLNLPHLFAEYEEASFKEISGLIEKMDPKLIPHEVFTTFMKRIYKRTK